MLALRFQLTSPEVVYFSLCLLTLLGTIFGHENGPGAVKVFASEGNDVILPCSLSTKENIESKLFDWKKEGQKEVFLYDAGKHYNIGRVGQDEQFQGRVAHFEDDLKYGNASIIITNAKMSDSGNYTCIFPRLQPPQTFLIELNVGCDPHCSTLTNKYGKTDGAAPEPCIRIVNVTESGVLLQCDVRGAFPQPELQWKDSDGNVLPAEEPQVSDRGGRYDVTLQTTVTKTTTNSFHCVALQEEIRHMTHANITVPEKLFEDASCKGTIGWVVGFFTGASAVAIFLGLLVATKRITIRDHRGSRQKENGSCNDASKPLKSSI